MARWHTRAAMAQALGLKAHVDDPEALRAELRDEQRRLHPDNHGGDGFSTKEAAERFHLVTEAIQLLDQEQPSTALVRLTDVGAIAKVLAEQLRPRQTAPERIGAITRQMHEETRHRLGIPRVGSAAFGGICGALLTLSALLKDDPTFAMFATPSARQGLLAFLMVSGVLYLMTKLLEHRHHEYSTWLTTADARRKLFSELGSEFTYQDVVRAVGIRARRGGALLGMVSLSAVESIATLHIDALEEQGVIVRVGARLDGPVYQLKVP